MSGGSTGEQRRQVYDALRTLMGEHPWRIPGQREIAKQAGLSSHTTVAYYLKQLEADGLIRLEVGPYGRVPVLVEDAS